MARLPSDRFLIQRIGENVILFEDYTEEELVKFDPSQPMEVLEAVPVIYTHPSLCGEDRAMALMWVGYFYALAAHDRHAVDLSILIPCTDTHKDKF